MTVLVELVKEHGVSVSKNKCLNIYKGSLLLIRTDIYTKHLRNVGKKLYWPLDSCGQSNVTEIFLKLLIAKFTKRTIKPNTNFYKKRQLVVTYKYTS